MIPLRYKKVLWILILHIHFKILFTWNILYFYTTRQLLVKQQHEQSRALIGRKSSHVVTRAHWLVENRHLWWPELSDWSKIVTLTGGLWLVDLRHVNKQKSDEKHQLNWKAKRTFCQSTFLYGQEIKKQQWHLEDMINCHQFLTFFSVRK